MVMQIYLSFRGKRTTLALFISLSCVICGCYLVVSCSEVKLRSVPTPFVIKQIIG